MSKNIIIAILTVVSVLSILFAYVQREEALSKEVLSHEFEQKAFELQKDLIHCKSEAEQQRQMALNAERLAIQMVDELRSKESKRK